MTKIDDEMVERAWIKTADFGWSRAEVTKRQLKMALEAALSPKPEPEIEVSRVMTEAGLDAKAPPGCPPGNWSADSHEAMARAYRAMRAIEPKAQEGAAYAAKSAPQGVNAAAPEQTIGSNVGRWGDAAPVKETGGAVGGRTGHIHGRATDIGFTFHSRKTDRA